MPPILPVVPLLAALAAVALVAATGFTERSFFGTALEDWFYGFFFRSYPLFLFALVYGAAWIVAAAAAPGARRGLRAFSTPVAVILLLASGLYPTFGGAILRSGFILGGMTFVRGGPAVAALALGSLAAAAAFGVALAIASLLARLSLRISPLVFFALLLRLAALWAGALLVLLSASAGFDAVGSWPVGPLAGLKILKTAFAVVLLVLPDTIVAAWLAGRAGRIGSGQRDTAPESGPGTGGSGTAAPLAR
jgi:hypothetical protein